MTRMGDMRQVLAIEAEILASDAAASRAYSDAEREAAAAIAAIVARYDAELASTGSMDGAGFDREVEEVQSAAIAAYAREVTGRFALEAIERWSTAVQAASLARIVVDALPGAASLLAALEPVPSEQSMMPGESLDQRLGRVVEECACGYARTRTLPAELCWTCSHVVEASWSDEEARLLTRAPRLAAAVSAVVDELLDRLADFSTMGGDDRVTARRAALGTARRRIAKLRADPSEPPLDLETWSTLALAATHDGRPNVRGMARRWRRTGLGTAVLASLAVATAPALEERIARRTADGALGDTLPTPFQELRRWLRPDRSGRRTDTVEGDSA